MSDFWDERLYVCYTQNETLFSDNMFNNIDSTLLVLARQNTSFLRFALYIRVGYENQCRIVFV